MPGKKILMLTGDFTEEYEIFVFQQAMEAVGHTVHVVCPDKKAGDILRTFLQKHLRRVGDRNQPGTRHFKYPDFVCGAKTVLGGAHDPVVVMSLALKIKDGVYNVFECFWTSDGTILGDVSNQKNRYAAVLCQQ